VVYRHKCDYIWADYKALMCMSMNVNGLCMRPLRLMCAECRAVIYEIVYALIWGLK